MMMTMADFADVVVTPLSTMAYRSIASVFQ